MAHLATLDVSPTSAGIQHAQVSTDLDDQNDLKSRLPASALTMFQAKAEKQLSFETLAKELGRSEVAVAGIFYGQVKPSEQDIKILSQILNLEHATLMQQLAGFPDRGRILEMPPKDPLIYRLFEVVQNYGYAYKAVMNEKFGDGIMSAVAFTTKVEKERAPDGNIWAVITMRGKWFVLPCPTVLLVLTWLTTPTGYHIPDFEYSLWPTHRSINVFDILP